MRDGRVLPEGGVVEGAGVGAGAVAVVDETRLEPKRVVREVRHSGEFLIGRRDTFDVGHDMVAASETSKVLLQYEHAF